MYLLKHSMSGKNPHTRQPCFARKCIYVYVCIRFTRLPAGSAVSSLQPLSHLQFTVNCYVIKYITRCSHCRRMVKKKYTI